MMRLLPLLTVALGWASPALASGLRLHNVFSSGMVLQAEAPVVYGTATPSSSVTVAVSGGEPSSAQAAADGSWTVRLVPRAASAPTKPGLTVTIISDGAKIELTDVLFGDTWVCGK